MRQSTEPPCTERYRTVVWKEKREIILFLLSDYLILLNAESIFSIVNSVLDNATNNGSLSQVLHGSFVCISPLIYYSVFWLATNKRKSQLVVIDASYNLNFAYCVYKYDTYEKMTDRSPSPRYAEVLMNSAEAEVRANGVTLKAQDLQSQTWSKAVTKTANQFSQNNFATPQCLMKAIFNDRHIDFVNE